MLRQKPDVKLGMLYQNDDFGKDYPAGVGDILGQDWGKHVVKAVTYEVTDPTVDSQIAELETSGIDVLAGNRHPKIRRPGDPEGIRP